MPDKTKDGGPAFPIPGLQNDADFNGMTLRDYLAAKAMQGYLSNSWQAKELDSLVESSSEQMAIVAEISYAMADAMLRAREDA
ncbi:hypothetical protein [Zoogloea dura]|uniref:Uncharacterized protein n=1 Tax=Zoogloea dura TaxID=2728840 RepID=A0A848FWT5_9RHOO|nr:hypothetical protein [Zoogloea dura]NML24298.1 hypothetical protein [Zoogloea dura]